MGKIVQERFPNLDDEDLEAVRQHAIATLNLVEQAKKMRTSDGDSSESTPNSEAEVRLQGRRRSHSTNGFTRNDGRQLLENFWTPSRNETVHPAVL